MSKDKKLEVLYKREVFQDMIGKIFTGVYKTTNQWDDDELLFINDKEEAIFYHKQQCCESVYIESIDGNLKDLIGSPILRAEIYKQWFENKKYEHMTYSFYRYSTVKGSVTVRWVGQSSGYYSEEVDYMYTRIEKGQDDE